MGKTIVLEIINPELNTERKIQTVLQVLAKATGRNIAIEHSHDESKSEPTPYKCLRELSDNTFRLVQAKLFNLYTQILKKWVRSDLEKASKDALILNGRTYINPKTGKYLTAKEWKIIQDDLTRVLKAIYKDSKEFMVKHAAALGKVLQSMTPDDRITVGLNDIDMPAALDDLNVKRFNYIQDFAEVHTGELIQDVTERSRKAIVKVIMQGYQDRLSTSELEDNLFDEFDVMNRDWRRIAETETANNFNNGYLQGELESNKEIYIFMQGISGGGSCSFCSSEINNRIVVLLDSPPATGDDTITIEGETYTAIWPGKNNFGRKRADWWVSAGTQHPHCRCSWVRMLDMTDPFVSKLRAAMKS